MDALIASFEAQNWTKLDKFGHKKQIEKIMEAVGDKEYIIKHSPRANAKLLGVIGEYTIELLYIHYGLERGAR